MPYYVFVYDRTTQTHLLRYKHYLLLWQKWDSPAVSLWGKLWHREDWLQCLDMIAWPVLGQLLVLDFCVTGQDLGQLQVFDTWLWPPDQTILGPASTLGVKPSQERPTNLSILQVMRGVGGWVVCVCWSLRQEFPLLWLSWLYIRCRIQDTGCALYHHPTGNHPHPVGNWLHVMTSHPVINHAQWLTLCFK